MADEHTDQSVEQQQAKQQEAAPTPPDSGQEQPASGGDKQDSGNYTALGVLGYIFPILFFLPLVMDDMKDNQFARFHANQQLVLLLAGIVGNFVGTITTVILIGLLLWPAIWIFLVVVAIMGIVNVVNEQKKPLPLIGGITLIK